MPRPPLILIGMHRSGTTFLAKVLEQSGVFMGVIKDHNFEAMHFLSLNQQTLWAAGGDWHKPVVPDSTYWKTMPAKVLYHEHFRVKYPLDRLRLKLRNPRWGWKEPRNTFTLKMWLSIWPQAKVLHIVRQPEEVARSLQKRNNHQGEVHKEELNNYDYCLQLAKQYADQGRSYSTALGPRYLEIEYEKLRSLDGETIKALDEFCGVSVEEALKKLSR